MNETASRTLIERFFRAVNTGDHEAVLACVSDEVIFDAPSGDREIGKEKFRWRLGLASRHRREQLGDIAVMVAEGGLRAAAEFTVRGTLRTSDEGAPGEQTYSTHGGMFFEIDDGLISRVTSYRRPGGEMPGS
jgi:steroid delta-isomerase-like uncharacterized protein